MCNTCREKLFHFFLVKRDHITNLILIKMWAYPSIDIIKKLSDSNQRGGVKIKTKRRGNGGRGLYVVLNKTIVITIMGLVANVENFSLWNSITISNRIHESLYQYQVLTELSHPSLATQICSWKIVLHYIKWRKF